VLNSILKLEILKQKKNGRYKMKSIFMKSLNAIKYGSSLPNVERITRRKFNKTFIEYDLIRKSDITPTHFYKRHSTPKI